MADDRTNIWTRSAVLRRALIALLVFFGCYLGAGAGTALRFSGVGTAVLFPPYAVLAAALMLTPVRQWWLYVLAAALGNFCPHLRQEGLTSFVLMAEVANIARALVAALGVRWLGERVGHFDTLRSMIVFLTFAVVAGPFIGAFLGAATVILHNPTADFWTVWQAWLLSNMLTGVTLLPLILIITTRAASLIKLLSSRRAIEAAVLSLSMLAVGQYVFTRPHDGDVIPASLYWPLPFLLWAAMRFGPGGMISALSAVASLAIVGAARGRGPFVSHDPAASLIQLQFFLIALCVPLLLLAALVRQLANTAAALQQSRVNYRTVVEDQTELICRFLPDGTYTFVNGAYCRYFKRSAEQLLGRTFWELIPPEAHRRARALLASINPQSPVVTIEHEVIAPDGEIRWQQWSNRGFFDQRGNIVDYQAIGRDITERKVAEEQQLQLEAQKQAAVALRESEARVRKLADAMPQIVWAARADGCVDYYNRRWYDFTGAVEGETGDASWLPVLHPDDRQPCLDRWYQSVRTGEPFQMELRFRLPATGEYRWHLGRGLPVRDDHGNIVRWYGTCTDVHDHVTAEAALRDNEAKLRDANLAKDRFLAALSHELRTPLTPVLLAAEAHLRDPGLSDVLYRDLNIIHTNTAIEVALIDDLLDLTRIGQGKVELHKTQVDVHDLLGNAVRTCSDHTVHSKSLRIVLELGAREHWVTGDPTRLSQVFWNMIRNAIKFSERGQDIIIRTADAPGQAMRIEFIDSGYGIEPPEMSRIFDAFEQGGREVTRRFGGMGLGLTLCKAFVDLHGGRISAVSGGRGMGATFRIIFPTIQPPEWARSEVGPRRPAPRTLSATVDSAPRRSARILLVEDHEFTATLLGRLLRESGHDVLNADSVATALDAASRAPIDLVISDLGLPDGNGLELMSQLALKHGLRGIALTGYGMAEDFRQSRNAGFMEHLVKPVSVEQVQAAIARVLSGAGTAPDGRSAVPS